MCFCNHSYLLTIFIFNAGFLRVMSNNVCRSNHNVSAFLEVSLSGLCFAFSM